MRDAILEPLREFNTSMVGEMRRQPLAIALRDPQNDAVIGGLWGHSVADWMFIDLLAVPETLRRRGIGASLMAQAEEIAIARGCVGLWLQTGTFQAPMFYEKLGYQCFGELPDYPRGHRNFYYCKRLPA